jgi:hypothetical protein
MPCVQPWQGGAGEQNAIALPMGAGGILRWAQVLSDPDEQLNDAAGAEDSAVVRESSVSSGVSHAWRALRHRNFRLFFAGQSISLIGTWMTKIATAWLVYRLPTPVAKGVTRGRCNHLGHNRTHQAEWRILSSGWRAAL